MDILKIDDKPFSKYDGRINLDKFHHGYLEFINKRLAKFVVVNYAGDFEYEYVIDLRNFQIVCIILGVEIDLEFNPSYFTKVYNGFGIPKH